MIQAAILFFTAMAASILIYPWVIGVLARARMGQQIREEGPAAHQRKTGTPTAGGLVFLFLAGVLYLGVDRSAAGGLILLALLAGGALGFADDYRAIRGGRNLGLRAREKIAIQLLTGAALSYLALRWGFDRQRVPFDGAGALGGWLVPIGAIAFAAGSNGFNLTDGVDGLAAGAGTVVFGALAAVALVEQQPSAALLPAVLAGALIGFLVYNFFPARIFMGDTGSLALGTAMVAAAVVTGFLWFLPLLAVIFVLETLSVIAQVASYKMTGKRIFRMSPLHNHFVLSGWPEPRIAVRFWAGGLLAAIVTFVLARPGGHG